MGQSCGRYSQFSAAQVEAYNKAKERFIIPVTTRGISYSLSYQRFRR